MGDSPRRHGGHEEEGEHGEELGIVKNRRRDNENPSPTRLQQATSPEGEDKNPRMHTNRMMG